MRNTLLAFTALTLSLVGPAAVADATMDAAMMDLLQNPPICGTAGSAESDDPIASMVMVDGFGTGGFQIDTQNPQAQAWFNHGVRLRWAFEHSESVRAFRKAQLLDPGCSMCAWGEAWAIGPNLNGGGRDEASMATGLAQAKKARRLARRATPMQRQMIDALIQRYSGKAETRATRYAQRLDRLATAHPDNVTLAALTSDAWMLTDYNWWNDDGTAANANITRTMGLLEHALQVNPNDPGAIHLYIHLTEWSDDPHKAIPYGERLAALAPGASHLVHMPSHTFYRVGRYRDAMMSNVNAVAMDKRYDQLAKPAGGIARMPLHGHNIHFGMGGALMSGGGEEGVKLADWFLATYPTIPPQVIFRQAMAHNAYAIYGRFADQDKVAGLVEPDETRPMLRISWRYARGEAAARRGDAAAVRAEAEALKALREGMPALAGRNGQMRDLFTEISQRVLEGRAAMLERNSEAAIAAFTRAAQLQAGEDGKEGGDPPIIWYPTRRSLAAAMLMGGDAAGAKAKILELLEDWPSDPYSLFVLAEAETALGNREAAAEARRKARVEWIGGEMSLAAA